MERTLFALLLIAQACWVAALVGAVVWVLA
jgi:hypothetical protein